DDHPWLVDDERIAGHAPAENEHIRVVDAFVLDLDLHDVRMNLARPTAHARRQREGNVLDNAAVSQRLPAQREHLARDELVALGVTVLEAKELVEAHAPTTNTGFVHT